MLTQDLSSTAELGQLKMANERLVRLKAHIIACYYILVDFVALVLQVTVKRYSLETVYILDPATLKGWNDNHSLLRRKKTTVLFI